MRQEKNPLLSVFNFLFIKESKLPESHHHMATEKVSLWCPVTKWRHFLWRNGGFKLRLSILKLPPLFLGFSILRSLLQAPKGNSDWRRSKPFQVLRHSSVSVVNSLTFIVLVTSLLRKPADTASSVCPMGESSVSGTNRLFPLSLCTRFTEISQGKLLCLNLLLCTNTRSEYGAQR